jgi:hypothetical protein
MFAVHFALVVVVCQGLKIATGEYELFVVQIGDVIEYY